MDKIYSNSRWVLIFSLLVDFFNEQGVNSSQSLVSSLKLSECSCVMILESSCAKHWDFWHLAVNLHIACLSSIITNFCKLQTGLALRFYFTVIRIFFLSEL